MLNKPNLLSDLPERCDQLTCQLQQAINSPGLTYREIIGVKEQGLYLIANDSGIIYVGKTTRSGQLRMRELAADFRSHTLNRKLLREYLSERGFEFVGSASDIKEKLIAASLLTEEEFRGHQAAINAHIRDKFTFRFFPVADSASLGRLEHFAIAILNPHYND